MNSQTDKVDELFAEQDKSDSPGAALAIIRVGSIIYKHGYKSVNFDYNVPITPESVFHQWHRLWRWKNLRGCKISKNPLGLNPKHLCLEQLGRSLYRLL